MFKRKAYDTLLDWADNSKGNKAMLIEGPRRVGKTTMAVQLGIDKFEQYVLIDFSRVDEKVISVFNHIPSPEKMDNFFGELFLSLGMSVPKRGSLIIFDEIQFCPKARQAIKHLVLDGRYYYIETGSLVSIIENTKDILIPSEEGSIDLKPLDFEEFLLAINEDYSLNVISNIYNNKDYEMEQKYHNQFMKQLKLYLAIGGMPQAVDEYVKTKDLYRVHNVKMDIIKLYEKDLDKIDSKYGTICKAIWSVIPGMLSSHDTKFVVSSVVSNKDSVLLKKSLIKLRESKIVNYIPKCNDPTLGLKLTESLDSFKLYYADTGIFTALVFEENKNDIENIYQKLVFSKLDSNLGMLYENMVCQALVSSGYTPYFFTWSENNGDKKTYYEVDFIITTTSKILPIEVKKSKNFTSVSFDEFRKKYKAQSGIILSPKALNVDGNKSYMPLYMMHLI